MSFWAISSACSPSVKSVFTSPIIMSMSAITPLLLPVFFVYAPKVSGGGGGAALDAARTCAKPAMPGAAVASSASRGSTAPFATAMRSSSVNSRRSGVRGAGLLRRGHQVLVVLLGHLLLMLALGQVGLHIADHHVHQLDHPVALA